MPDDRPGVGFRQNLPRMSAHSHGPDAAPPPRRRFLRQIAVGAPVVTLGAPMLACASATPLPGEAAGPTPTPTPTPTPAPAPSRRRLGTLEVSSIGMGVQNVARRYTTTVPYRPDMVALVRAAYDEHGVTFFDCAEAYGPHEAERILGEAIAPFRDRVVITSKFGFDIDPETGERRGGRISRPARVKQAVEGMLRRLQTDRIDLLYQHRVDPEVPIEDVAGAVADLIDEGKVLHWGLCEMGLRTLRRAHAALPVTAVQSEYSMLWRGPEAEVLPTCEELGIGFVPWSPLGVQLLTGEIDARTRFAEGDFRKLEGRFEPEHLAHNVALVDVVRRWAERKAVPPAQIALAWLLAQKPYIVPIPGTTRRDHLRQNAAAANVTFTPTELDELNAQVRAIEIRGSRLPEPVLSWSGVEARER